MTRADVYALIDAERQRQAEQWAGFHARGNGEVARAVLDLAKLGVLAEELGEVARAVLDGDGDGLRAELAQVAAVAVAWLESLT